MLNKHTISQNQMQVDTREILFIRKNAPMGFMRTLANNLGLDYNRTRQELYYLKDEYPENLIVEARRLLKAMTGLEYQQPENAA